MLNNKAHIGKRRTQHCNTIFIFYGSHNNHCTQLDMIITISKRRTIIIKISTHSYSILSFITLIVLSFPCSRNIKSLRKSKAYKQHPYAFTHTILLHDATRTKAVPKQQCIIKFEEPITAILSSFYLCY